MTRRALLIDILSMVGTILEMLSDHWTANMPAEGCEGTWEVERARAQVLREWVREVDAGESSEDPETWKKRIGVLENGKVIAEAFKRRLCNNGVLNEPYPDCRGAWDRETAKQMMILVWIEEIKRFSLEVRNHEMADGAGADDRRDAGSVGQVDGGQPQAGAMGEKGSCAGKAGKLDPSQHECNGIKRVEVTTPHQPPAGGNVQRSSTDYVPMLCIQVTGGEFARVAVAEVSNYTPHQPPSSAASPQGEALEKTYLVNVEQVRFGL